MPYSDINRVVLVGRLTRDPELRAMPAGGSVCSLRVACKGLRKDPDGDGYEERPNFFDVSAFGRTAETIDRYLGKGSRIGIDGRLQWREWETAEGERRQGVEVIADAVQFLDGAPGEERSEEPLDPREAELVGAGAEIPF